MKKIFKTTLLLAALTFALSSCTQTDEAKEKIAQYRSLFLTQTEQGVSISGVTVKSFDEQTDQVIYNDLRSIYVMTNMDYSAHYTLAITGEIALNSSVTVNLATAGISGLSGGTYSMSVIQTDENDQRYWLWDSSAGVGIVVDFEF